MTKILISYYKVQEIPVNKTLCLWDGLTQELTKNGNDVLLINTAYFNPYKINTVGNKKINRQILTTAKQFDPDLIITFNHKIPKCILDHFTDVPIVIYDGDELGFFSDLEYVEENINRYTLFSIVNEWRQGYLDFGFNNKQIHYMPVGTPIKAEDIPQDKNISFLGTIHYNSGKLCKLIKKHEYDSTFKQIITEQLNTSSYDYEDLFRKYFEDEYDSLGLTEIDLFPMFNHRIITLINLLDLGLHINGYRWNMVTKILPQLAAVCSPELMWTVEENQNYFNSSKISINPIHPQAKGSGFSWRVFDIMASNACLVCEHSSDLKALTKDYLDIPMYHTPWEAREICKELLNDDNARKEIVLASQKYIEENARWVHRFKEMENILNIKLINPGETGKLINLVEDEEFIEQCAEFRRKKFGKKISLKNKIRYRIWRHFNKILKKKRIIK